MLRRLFDPSRKVLKESAKIAEKVILSMKNIKI